jgi:hypothetical protein
MSEEHHRITRLVLDCMCKHKDRVPRRHYLT